MLDFNSYLYEYKIKKAKRLFVNGKLKEALNCFNRALKIKPFEAKVYYERGKVYSFLKKYDMAIEDFTKAIKLDPENEINYIERGEVYFLLGKYNYAIDDFNKVIELEPRFESSYYLKGKAYYKIGKYKKAIKNFNKAINLSLNDDEKKLYYKKRGDAYKKLIKFNKKIECKNIEDGYLIAYADSMSLILFLQNIYLDQK